MSIYEEAYKKTKKKVGGESSATTEESEAAFNVYQDRAQIQGTDPSRSEAADVRLGPVCDTRGVSVSCLPVIEKMRRYLEGIWGNVILQRGEKPKSMLFCGGSHGEGVTFVSFHLSLFLSVEYSMKVLYVDTGVEELEKSRHVCDIPGHPGLASYLLGSQTLESLIAKTEHENLFVIPAGSAESRGRVSGIIARKESLEAMSQFCRQHFDLVIYDGLPATMYPSVFIFARLVDQVILVCRYAFSRREVLKLVKDKMTENGIAVSGIILNDREYPVPGRIYRFMR